MFQYSKYKIDPEDSFQPDDFPKVRDELADLCHGIAGLPADHKKEIVLSFIKNHLLNTDWLKSNPELTSLVTSGAFATGHLESLFDSCRMNKQFQQEYEDYIREMIV
ncbi:MAG TPA: hypothetical protein VHD35_03190 [Chitinophagaceae bacterium]|nr:hypothetical protein [Chitinophagaceae bacterium]